MLGTFGDPNWATLIDRIKRGECTPFLGAGIAAEHLPTGSEVATCWARQYSYPMPDITNLIKVSQFVGLKERDLRRPKEMIIEIINEAQYPDFTDTHEPHAVLAKLPLPLYMTTNYDDFMYAALESQGKQPQLFINQWNDDPEASASPVDINPTDRSPAVYHFHGHKDYPDTLVLTEDDYLDFLVGSRRIKG